MSFFRRRKAGVQVQESQASLVHPQQQQLIREQLKQQQQASATARERETEQQRERIERERERQALQSETAQRERERDLGGSPSPQQQLWPWRDQASPPTNQQQQQMVSQARQQKLPPPLRPPPQKRERERNPPSSRQSQQQSQSKGSDGHKASLTDGSTYAWSVRRLAIQPVSTLIRQPGPPVQSPSPFPRYGHSLPLTSTNNGELFLFGGLVNDQIKNDLYSFSTRDFSVALIETKGAAPPPRVGHASALVSSVLIVWGGDTKTSPSESRDDALYFLNLGTMDWTRVSTPGRAPAGRYGHAVTMCGTRFFVFGGQVDGEFLNDLWAFDLQSLKPPDPRWDLYTPLPGTDVPARRTGHVCVTHGEKIYMFGGTDGQYHYNDTWCFDVPSRTWRELTCIGFTPVPREGHAAALVDDVMYVFGGRGVDGKNLSDLAAFKISNSRWYKFHNMGPSPSGRLGHAMAAAGSQVFVLGGESFTTENPDDPSLIHVLDTRHINHPDLNRALPANKPPPGLTQGRHSAGASSAATATPLQEQERPVAQQLVAGSSVLSQLPLTLEVTRVIDRLDFEFTSLRRSSSKGGQVSLASLFDFTPPSCPTEEDQTPDAIPTETDSDGYETILRSTLDALAHLYVAPSRLIILDSTEVGCGRYGEVLLATLDGSSNAPIHVAVKELRTVEARGVRKRIALRLARELKIWAKVNHPNLLSLLGYYLSENYEIARFISPLMANGNVSQYLERGQVGVPKRLDFTNVLVNDNLRAVLCDFGLAKFIQDSGVSSGLTTSRSIKGSLRYMSPELNLIDDARHTLASDVWAWGCTAFEIVTGHAPYEESTKDTTILLAIVQKNPPNSIDNLFNWTPREANLDVFPALKSLQHYLPQCWEFDADKRPRMANILHLL